MASKIERVDLAPDLNVPRAITGLWQVADLERSGTALDPDIASDALLDYCAAGLDGFDMADHYGSAELIAAAARRKLAAQGSTAARFFTKWCPHPSQWRPDAVRNGVQERLDRLGTDRIDLLQLHWWDFAHPGWIDVLDELTKLKAAGKIGAIGVTNFDADHLHLALNEGYEIATNQVSFSVIDRRAAGQLSEVCARNGVKLLAYGTLAGGFLSDRWLGAAEPAEIGDWSKMKYKRFIDTAGGWHSFQSLLSVLDEIARRYDTSISNVASRWVLDHPAVGAVIIGARLTERSHASETARLFEFALSSQDHEALDAAFEGLAPIPGDCGQEYRKPPFLTASGDLSHHLAEMPKVYDAVETGNGRQQISSGSVWEEICGFSRAVRIGDRILVSGTTATHLGNRSICDGDVRGQTIYILDKIAAAIASLGGRLEDVVRTRIYMRDSEQWEAASRVHGNVFAAIRPANTLIEVSNLVGGYDVEIEAEAVIGLDQ